jgi:hypothetical protein
MSTVMLAGRGHTGRVKVGYADSAAPSAASE